MKRIEQYADSSAEPIENKRALGFLYMEVMKKRMQLKSHDRNMPIVNLNEFLIDTQNQINKLRNVQKSVAGIEHQYKNVLKNEIESAYELIKTTIIPEIEIRFIETDAKIVYSLKDLYGVLNISKNITDAEPDENSYSVVSNPHNNDTQETNTLFSDSVGCEFDSSAKGKANTKIPATKREYYAEKHVSKLGNISKLNIYSPANFEKQTISQQSFFWTINSRLRKFQLHLNVVSEYLRDKDRVTLNFIKWNLRETLRDLKVLFRQLPKEIPEKDGIARNFEKLEELIDYFIDTYSRISSNLEKLKLAEYFETIATSELPRIDNIDLSRAIQNLKQIIQTNLILDKYDLVMEAFKRHHFPLAHIHLKMYQLSLRLQLNDTATLIQTIIDKTDLLIEKLQFSGISKYDGEVFSDVDFGKSDASVVGPFYMWQNDEIKREIERLLNGEEITIEVDIEKGISQNAVKFNEIGIKLMAPNQEVQTKFETELDNFAITMTLVGNNRFRCGNKIYCIPMNDNIVIDFTFKTHENGDPSLSNDVYKKIRNNGYFLSPYGTWSIKLRNVKANANSTQSVTDGFRKLKSFAAENLNVALIGRGQYFNNGPLTSEVCSDELDKIYDTCDGDSDQDIGIPHFPDIPDLEIPMKPKPTPIEFV